MIIVKLGRHWLRGTGRLSSVGIQTETFSGHGSSWGHLMFTLQIDTTAFPSSFVPGANDPFGRAVKRNIITYPLWADYNAPYLFPRSQQAERFKLWKEYIHCEMWPTMLDKNRIRRMNKALEKLGMGYRVEMEEL